MKHFSIIFLLFSVTSWCTGQSTNKPEPISVESRLKTLRINTLKSQSDKEIDTYNSQFKEALLKAIETEVDFKCDSIPSLGCINSPDKQFVLYTWNIIKEYSEYEYFAILKFKKGEILELEDQSNRMQLPEFKITNTDNWFGALYYEIVPVKNNNKERYYVLLGWDGNSSSSIKKVIDVLYFDPKLGNWQLGKKIFGPPFRDQTRFFLEYSSEVNASLKYHEKENRIVFDHLVPLNSGLEGVFEFYVPDLSFDGFEFREDYWYFVQNIDVRGNQTMEKYTTPKTNIRID